MNRKEKYKEELDSIIKRIIESGERRELYAYLIDNSHLPGPRANLELSGAFADLVEQHAREDPGSIWGWLNAMMAFYPEEAPVNDPKEFLPFCGVKGMAALTSACPYFLKAALGKLKALSEDKRWRIREAVAQGIQKLLVKERAYTLKALHSWVSTDNWLIMRAVAAGVAEPTLLKQPQITKASFELHRKILSAILDHEERHTEAFRILRKTLGYTLSVIIESDPVQGFSYLRKLAKSGDSDLRWIVNENLKKNRLLKNFPDEVRIVKDAMGK
ncbi:MAG: hypothetical protein JSV46_11520 [Candidatus Aminicenantes bacterium]|nr:MAG: hypothetical protein JSV46_11520 [Candidatus Aminicenantes bacterium]